MPPCLLRVQASTATCLTRLKLTSKLRKQARVMWRRSVRFLMVISSLATALRRSMASHAAANVRYTVQLLPPKEGPVLGVGHNNEKASALSSYKVLQEPVEAPWDGLQVCVWVDSFAAEKEKPSMSGPFCFERQEQQLPIDGLGVGSHRLSATVLAPSQKGPALSEVATMQIDVVLRQPFAPSYMWQKVYHWQSVPPGLEVQLPLDGVGSKLARIPPSWRLQLYVPGEMQGGKEIGGFFVRTDLSAGSTVLELRREIWRHDRFDLPLERLRLTLGGRILGDEETVQDLDLFNRQRELRTFIEP